MFTREELNQIGTLIDLAYRSQGIAARQFDALLVKCEKLARELDSADADPAVPAD